MKPILAASAVLLAYLIWGSRQWPLIHDGPLMHYVAWLIGQGAVPYRDVFDMNFPGVYLIHWAVLTLGGVGDGQWRLFDLGWLAATCAALFAYCRPLSGRTAAGAAAVLFALYHLSGGAWRAGQRDFLLALFLLLGAWGVARAWERGGAGGPLLWGGVFLGAAITVKPHAGLFWVASAAVSAWIAWRAGRSALAAGSAVVAGGLLVHALVLGWLEWRGGLRPFWAVLTGYVLPLYSQVGQVALGQALGWPRYGVTLLVLLGALGALGLLAPAAASFGTRKALAALGVVYGVLHFWLQGKGWEYQLYPLALFLCALAAPALATVGRAAGSPAPALAAWRRPVALAVLALTVLTLGAKGVEALEAPWITEKARRVAAVARDLAPLVPLGSAVQVMDVTEGGVHVLLRLGYRQPTRFLYDFHFFHHVGDPRIEALRAEFASALEARPPAALVVFRDTWNRPGYERLETFPALAELLAQRYLLAVEGNGYRIYAKRSDP